MIDIHVRLHKQGQEQANEYLAKGGYATPDQEDGNLDKGFVARLNLVKNNIQGKRAELIMKARAKGLNLKRSK